MGSFSPIHWIIALGVIGVLFGGRGKLSGIMGDAAKGIRAFKDGLKDEEHPAPAATVAPPAQIAAAPPPHQPTVTAAPVSPQREDLSR